MPAAPGKRPQILPERKAKPELLTLSLGDFIDRIPAELLEDREHDRSIPLTFDLGALSERIWRGETEIAITEIFQRAPEVFRANVMKTVDATIRFPWRKVMGLIAQARESGTAIGLTSTGVEMLSLKLQARNLLRATVQAATPSLREPARVDTATQNAEPAAPPAPPAALPVILPEPPAPPAVNVQPAAELATVTAPPESLAQPDAEHEQQLAALASERDAAVSELDPLRTELTRQLEQMALQRREAAEVSDKLSQLQQEQRESGEVIEALKAERDAAVDRAAQFGIEHEAAISRLGDITAERDDAVRQFATMTANSDAAVLLGEMAAERDTALALAVQHAADAEAALALATELTAERDVAVAVAAAEPHKPEAAPSESPEQAAWESRAVACFEADIAAYRKRIQTLLEEREAVSKQPAQPVIESAESAFIPQVVPRPLVADAYSTLFQPRFQMSRAAVALVLGFLALGIAILSRVTVSTSAPEASATPSHFAVADYSFPTLAELPLAECGITLESPGFAPSMTLVGGSTLASSPR